MVCWRLQRYSKLHYMITVTFLYTRNVKDSETKYPELRADTFEKTAASTGGIAGASPVSHVTIKLTI